MKRKALSLWSKVLAALLALFGITSCEDQFAMYGCPTASFYVKGTVTDTANNPIPDIRVTVETWKGKHKLYTDTLFTDSIGAIDERNHQHITFPPDSVSIKFDDIDGEENGGEFQSEVLSPEVIKISEAKGQWDGGSAKVEFDVKLKKK